MGEKMSRAGACSFSGCGRDIKAKGLCTGHYEQRRLGQALELLPADRVVPTCVGPECDRPGARAGGLCTQHYVQANYYGWTELRPIKPARIYTDEMTCLGPGCSRVPVKLGLCESHYSMQRVKGSLAPLGQPLDCGEPGCTGIHHGDGGNLCPRSAREVAASRRRWRAENRDRINRKAVEREARRKGYMPIADRIWMQTHRWRDQLRELDGDLCAWCNEPLGDRVEVDHDHNCEWHSANGVACPQCVRGLLHPVCNTKWVARWDWVVRNGLGPLPDDVAIYLDRRPLLVALEAQLRRLVA